MKKVYKEFKELIRAGNEALHLKLDLELFSVNKVKKTSIGRNPLQEGPFPPSDYVIWEWYHI